MKAQLTRLSFVVIVLAAFAAQGPVAPDIPQGDAAVKTGFRFGITVQAEEDCDDGTAEHQQCGGSFGIEGPIGGGGGGGGGQRLPRCTWVWSNREECLYDYCDGVQGDKVKYIWEYCRRLSDGYIEDSRRTSVGCCEQR